MTILTTPYQPDLIHKEHGALCAFVALGYLTFGREQVRSLKALSGSTNESQGNESQSQAHYGQRLATGIYVKYDSLLALVTLTIYRRKRTM